MGIEIGEQIAGFYHSLIVGIVLFIIYDLIVIIRDGFKIPIFWVNVVDVIFAFLASLISFGLTLTVYPGKVRVYIFAGIIIGGAAYNLLIGKYVSRFIISKIIKIRKHIKSKIKSK